MGQQLMTIVMLATVFYQLAFSGDDTAEE